MSAPARYRAYVAGSLGEFSCVKGGYVDTRQRLVQGPLGVLPRRRPAVVLQSTGFEDLLPVGEGAFAVRDVEDAAAAMAEIRGDYDRHARAAREIARESLNAEPLLARMLSRVDCHRGRPHESRACGRRGPGLGWDRHLQGGLGTALRDVGHDVHLVLRGWEHDATVALDGLTVHRVTVPEPSWRRGTVAAVSRLYVARQSLIFSARVAKVLVRIGPDVVEAPEFHAAGLLLALRARLDRSASRVVPACTRPRFLIWILRSEIGEGWTELGCHPGRVRGDFTSIYLSEHEVEIATLTDPRVRQRSTHSGSVWRATPN